MSPIERISSNTPWEPVFGYCRAVKAGEWLAISGTTATDESGRLVGFGQMYVQARQALQNIKSHVERAGMSIGNVVRTRVFVTDISRFAEVARAHKEMFGDHPPAATCVEVTRLVHPDMLVEIEADVYAGGGSPARSAEIEATRSEEPARKRNTPRPKPADKAPPAPRMGPKTTAKSSSRGKPGRKR